MKVSVIVNCFNGEKYLKDCLSSIVNQTYQDWELIFWDNNSSDRSAEIFDSFCDVRFRYFKSENTLALGQARNQAVSMARYDLIAFCDVDDIWINTKLSLQVEHYEKFPNLGFVYGRSQFLFDGSFIKPEWRNWIRNNETAYCATNELIFYRLTRRNFIFFGSVLINKNVFFECGGISSNLKQAEDYDILLKIAKNYPVSCIRNVVYIYRMHSENLTNSQTKLDFLEVQHILAKYLPDLKVLLAMIERVTKFFIISIYSKLRH
jgi:glycosyltransferase involved in cell wall biosynthesis